MQVPRVIVSSWFQELRKEGSILDNKHHVAVPMFIWAVVTDLVSRELYHNGYTVITIGLYHQRGQHHDDAPWAYCVNTGIMPPATCVEWQGCSEVRIKQHHVALMSMLCSILPAFVLAYQLLINHHCSQRSPHVIPDCWQVLQSHGLLVSPPIMSYLCVLPVGT